MSIYKKLDHTVPHPSLKDEAKNEEGLWNQNTNLPSWSSRCSLLNLPSVRFPANCSFKYCNLRRARGTVFFCQFKTINVVSVSSLTLPSWFLFPQFVQIVICTWGTACAFFVTINWKPEGMNKVYLWGRNGVFGILTFWAVVQVFLLILFGSFPCEKCFSSLATIWITIHFASCGPCFC